jgi:hypothetical protein
MSRASVPGVLAVTLVAALVLFVPHLKSRVVSDGTPVPQPLLQLALFPLPHGKAACIDQVAVESGDQVALFDIDTPQLAPPLRVRISGDSYKQVHTVPRGSISGQIVVPFRGPRSSKLTTVCIRNLGPGDIELRGTNEARTLSRPRMTIGGAPTAGEYSLAFRSANGESTFKLVGTIARRMSAFKPVWVQPWLVIALLALVLGGAFVAPLVALWRSFALDERQ